MKYDHMPPAPSIREYLDELNLVIRVVDYPADDVTPSEGYFVAWQGIEIPVEEAARQVRAVAWDDERQVFHPYVMEQKLTDFSWGASGTALTFLVDLGTGLSTEAVAAAIGFSVARIRGRKRDRHRDIPADPEEITALAQQALLQVFQIPGDKAVVDEFEQLADVCIVKFQTPAGARFEAKVAVLESGNPYVRVQRIT